MLGVCLLFVGIVLINNGMCTLYKVDGKSAAVMNILTGAFLCLSILSVWSRAIITLRAPAFYSALLICLLRLPRY